METRFKEAVRHLAAARIGLSLGKEKQSRGGDALPAVADDYSPDIVEEYNSVTDTEFLSMDRKGRFGDLVSPLSVREFFSRQYPHSRPMLFRGPSKRFESLVEWEDLDELVCGGRLHAEETKLFMGGVQLPVELYAMTPYGSGGRQSDRDPAMADGHKLTSLLRQGATLVVDAVHRVLPSVSELAQSFEREVHSYSRINLYSSWRSTPGFGTHWDDHDVFVVQVRGEKLWQLYRPTRSYPTQVDIVLDDKTPSAPIWKGYLTAGDMFYIPRGWWHDARVPDTKQGMGSIHLTCQFRTLTGQDLLAWLGTKLAEHELFRKNVPIMAREGQLAEYLEEFGNLVESVFDSRTAPELKDDFRNRWTERPVTAFGQRIDPWKSPRWDRYQIVLRGYSHASLDRNEQDGAISLTANGWTHTLDPRCADLVQMLEEHGQVTVEALKAVSPGKFPAGFVDDFVQLLISKAIVVATPPRV